MRKTEAKRTVGAGRIALSALLSLVVAMGIGRFAFTPQVHDIDAWWQMKQHGFQRPQSGFLPVHMPKNTGAGIILAGISTLLGFALIWHMWLLAGASFVALLAVTIGHTFNYKRDYYIPAEEVTRVESERTRMLAEHV